MNKSSAPTLMPSVASEVAGYGVPSGADTTLVPMPTATAMMPPSAIGVSNTRRSPYFFCNPSVTRNTLP